MRVLWFNWRDIKNPEAGGAEVLTQEVMSRLVRKGHDMTLFTAQFPGCLDYEEIEGVKIVRSGGKYSIYRRVKDYYKTKKNDYDIVVDEINTRPFLTPQFVREKPILALIHQLAREDIFYDLSFPLSFIIYHYLEKKWLSYYKTIPIITVSNSTKEELKTFLRLKDSNCNIIVAPQGLSARPRFEMPKKEDVPTVAFVGRLKRYKLPDHAIEAFYEIRKKVPDAKMWVIGDGYMREELEKKYSDNNKSIIFFGKTGNELKYDLMGRAHLLLVPSVKEGWGLVVTEANAMGTPAIAYNVSGLRDSVTNGETGLLTAENTPQSLANSAISLLKDKELLSKFSINALNFSRRFSWQNTADVFEKVILNIVQRKSMTITDRATDA
jgi:glycosyltransferase involved in cell wall biosynthesis